MGQVQSAIDPRHVNIYKKIIAIQNPATKLQMIDTIMGDPSVVHSAKLAGVYANLLQVSAAIRHGGTPPPLPGEQTPQIPAPPQIQQRSQLPSQLQYHPQAFQNPPKQTNQLIPTIQTRDQDPFKQVSKPKKSEKALNFFSACLRVLNIQEEVALTEQMLKSAYKKAVIKVHPDKGGTKEAFDAVTRAYAYLMDILKLIQGRQSKAETTGAVPGIDTVHEKRREAANEWQMPSEPVKLNPKNLDMNAFNKLFEQTRIPDPDEDGYGDWLKETNDDKKGGKKAAKKFSEDFNREVFNRMFEEEAGYGSTAIIQFQHPQELVLNQSAGVELGRDRPSEYTAAYDSKMQFTDLRSAYTKENTVTNQVQNVHVENRDFNKYKAQRERAPDAYSQSELAALQAYEAQQKAREEQRRIRAAQEQVSARDYFERMKQLVITNK